MDDFSYGTDLFNDYLGCLSNEHTRPLAIGPAWLTSKRGTSENNDANRTPQGKHNFSIVDGREHIQLRDTREEVGDIALTC
jgi:hypothetical protein